MHAIVEICTCSVEGAIAARDGGAQRIELCSGLVEGGITPSFGLIKLARKAFPPPGRLVVLIRPRGGDFIYTDTEMEVMYEDIRAAAHLGADCVAIGCLDVSSEIDTDRMSKLLQVAKSEGLDTTFHRAFDMCKDLFAALQQIKALGIRRVLTSGGMPNAVAGVDTLTQLVAEAKGQGLCIIAAGSITHENVAHIVEKTGVTEVHSSAKRSILSQTKHRNPLLSLCGQASDYAWTGTDASSVSQLCQILKATVAHA